MNKEKYWIKMRYWFELFYIIIDERSRDGIYWCNNECISIVCDLFDFFFFFNCIFYFYYKEERIKIVKWSNIVNI